MQRFSTNRSYDDDVNDKVLEIEDDRSVGMEELMSFDKSSDCDEFSTYEKETFSAEMESDIKPKSRDCLLYTSPSPRDQRGSRMPSSA